MVSPSPTPPVVDLLAKQQDLPCATRVWRERRNAVWGLGLDRGQRQAGDGGKGERGKFYEANKKGWCVQSFEGELHLPQKSVVLAKCILLNQ
jgi:hypothetical protein